MEIESSQGENGTSIVPGDVEVLVGDMFVNALNQSPDRPTICIPGQTAITAADLARTLSRYMQAITASGVRKGERVAILANNRVETLYFVNACVLSGVTVVALPPKGSIDDHAYMVRDADVQALFFDPMEFDTHVAALATATATERLLSIGPSQCVAIDLDELARRFAPLPLAAPRLPGDHVLRLAYSGGTTGRPKAIVLTHRTMTACLNIQLSQWDWPQAVRQLICASLSHAGASLLNPTVLRGGSVTIMPRFDAEAVMAEIERGRITCVLLVPAMIYAIIDHPRFGDYDLSSLETIFYGASIISPYRLREAINKIGPVFCQFYGQSEAPNTMTVMRRHEHIVENIDRLRSCGKPVPQIHLALLDDGGNAVPDGTPGEICMQGPLAMTRYWRQPEMTAAAFDGGWLHTGDIGIRDRDGFITIVDRRKDMVITGGFNVYPREIEDVLTSHPAVATSAVFGVPNEHWGEIVIATVVPREGGDCDLAELIALVRRQKGVVHTPKHIIQIEAVPLTPAGKPDKKALRVRFAHLKTA